MCSTVFPMVLSLIPGILCIHLTSLLFCRGFLSHCSSPDSRRLNLSRRQSVLHVALGTFCHAFWASCLDISNLRFLLLDHKFFQGRERTQVQKSLTGSVVSNLRSLTMVKGTLGLFPYCKLPKANHTVSQSKACTLTAIYMSLLGHRRAGPVQ